MLKEPTVNFTEITAIQFFVNLQNIRETSKKHLVVCIADKYSYLYGYGYGTAIPCDVNMFAWVHMYLLLTYTITNSCLNLR